ncbi:hypothetical protein [Actinomadura litoris]|uniref:hypothetical protein n=1 Tax=Actinomadura litoris TaxID=2678616 RepID=UPI001FA7FAA0|nr:hypothetical protein [Actinomadura litoris]
MYAYVVRTLVPLLVGVVVGQAARIGLALDPTAVYAIVTPTTSLGYGAAARWVELHFPAMGRWLLALGLTTLAPEYASPRR